MRDIFEREVFTDFLSLRERPFRREMDDYHSPPISMLLFLTHAAGSMKSLPVFYISLSLLPILLFKSSKS